MVKLQESKGTHFVSIPMDIIEDKGWKKGENLMWQYDSNGNIVLKEKRKKDGPE